MNSCNSAHHRERYDECCDSAEKPDDQSNPAEKFPRDYQKGQSRWKVQMFAERAHAAGKTGSAIPSQHFLSAVGKEYDTQYDARDSHNQASLSTCENLDHQSLP